MPKLIKGWEDIAGLVSEDGRYRVEVDVGARCGWIRPNFEFPPQDYFKHNFHLSTHSFYWPRCKDTAWMLRKYGFDVQSAYD